MPFFSLRAPQRFCASSAHRSLPWLVSCSAVLCLALNSWAGEIASKPLAGDLSGAQQYIVGGPASGTPTDSPALRVDPNTATSPFAGVVSISVTVPSGSFIGSGVLIDSTHILTAGHVLDVVGNDGVADPTLGNVSVFFNNGGITIQGISQISMNPHYDPNVPGHFLNDDLAILTLSSPAPVGTPTYALSTNPFDFVQDIIMVGYGRAGDGVTGDTVAPSFLVKRKGENLASTYVTDDEGSGSKELYLFDFDGPTAASDTLNDGLTFGNDVEATLGGGDSGGPAFLWNDLNLDDIIQPNELEVFGIDTFGLNSAAFVGPSGAAPPFFASWGGGVLVSSSLGWIQSVVPEPSAIALMLVGTIGLAGLTRSARRKPA